MSYQQTLQNRTVALSEKSQLNELPYPITKVKPHLWIIFQLISLHVPVPNGAMELKEIAALFDSLVKLAEAEHRLQVKQEEVNHD